MLDKYLPCRPDATYEDAFIRFLLSLPADECYGNIHDDLFWLGQYGRYVVLEDYYGFHQLFRDTTIDDLLLEQREASY